MSRKLAVHWRSWRLGCECPESWLSIGGAGGSVVGVRDIRWAVIHPLPLLALILKRKTSQYYMHYSIMNDGSQGTENRA